MAEEFGDRLYGQILIEERMRQLGVSAPQLCNKIYGPQGSKSAFYRHLKNPMQMTIREVRAISVLLGFTAEEIYRSFILLEGWPRDCVEKYNGRDVSTKASGDTKVSKRTSGRKKEVAE